MTTNYINYASRTEALSKMEPGESILLVPYGNAEFQRESSNIKVMAKRMKRIFTIKSVLMVVEGEVPARFLRVTREKDVAEDAE
ncbi:TPA: hypothetical protein LU109_003596 [Enterobacter hormaechei subsp. xiangfangensis]|nr:hypothetical protein [Enterobacter hormaechei subsp. xiangfangensis]